MEKYYIKHSETQSIIVAVEAPSEEEALKRFEEWIDNDTSLWEMVSEAEVQSNNEIVQEYLDREMVDRELSDAEYQEFQLPAKVRNAEQCLIDNGIAKDEAKNVLQALGYILMDKDLY